MDILMKKNGKIHWAIYFSRLVFIGLVVFELLNVLKIIELNTQFTWVGLLVTSCFSFVLLELIAHKYKKEKGHDLHWSIWLVVAFGLSLDAAGDFFHFFARYEWYDQAVHFSMNTIVNFILFVIISAFYVDGFRYGLLMKTGRFNLSLFISSTSTMSLGALYEVEEYTEDLLFHTNRLGSGPDTANDLFMNSLGILFAISILVIIYKMTKNEEVLE